MLHGLLLATDLGFIDEETNLDRELLLTYACLTVSRTAARRATSKGRKNVPRDNAKRRKRTATVQTAENESFGSGSKGRHKLSISVPAEMAAWVQAEANRLRVSASFIFVDAVERARRQRAWDVYLEQAGEADISDGDVGALREELQAAGVSV